MTSSSSKHLQVGVVFLLLGIAFAIGYTQSPLFTSNQNQYFLHGLAEAGYGNLNLDWLANTLDPTPVFSLLVTGVYSLVQSGLPFYILYALLMGVYVFSLYRIGVHIFRFKPTRTESLVFIGLIILVHSAAIRFALSRSLGVNWTYILEDGVADQRMLGPVLQPSTFGVFLMLSIFLALTGRPYLAVLSAALAATFHPTYLLTAGTLTFAYMLNAYLEEKSLVKSVLVGGLALLAVLPILLYVYNSFAVSSAESTEAARDILVNFRIPHHARIDWWFDATAVVKILLVTGAVLVTRRDKPLFRILVILGLTAVGLSLVQYFTGSLFLALLFPWRISIVLVPLATSILLGYLVWFVYERFPGWLKGHDRWVALMSWVVILLVAATGALRMVIDFERKATADYQGLTAYVEQSTQRDDLYLTPTKLQEFRLETGAPVLVDFKSIPYQSEDVLEWYRRIQLADQFYKRGDCQALDEMINSFGVTHLVIENTQEATPCPGLNLDYEDPYYKLYLIEPVR